MPAAAVASESISPPAKAPVPRLRPLQADDEASVFGPAATGQPLRRVIVRNGGRLLIVPAREIDWIESADNYAVLHAGRVTHVVRETLNELEIRLGGGCFLRIGRQTLVNVDRVREIRSERGHHRVVLADGESVPITRGIREVLARLEVA